MTKAQKKYKPRKRRNYRKRRYPLVSMGVPSGMPTIRKASLKYAQNLSITCTAGALNEHKFSANNIYDPDVTGTGHQPMGHDQWALLFNHYVVLGSRIRIRLCNSDTTVSPAVVGTYLSDGLTLAHSTSHEFIESRKGYHKMLSPAQNNVITLRNKFSAKKFFNVKDMKDNIIRLGAAMGASPTEQAYYHIWFQTLDASNDTIRLTVELEYIVLFSEPKDLLDS